MGKKKIHTDAFGYSLGPTSIRQDLWIYESRRGLEIYLKLPNRLAEKIDLSWRQLDQILKRRAKAVRKRRKRP